MLLNFISLRKKVKHAIKTEQKNYELTEDIYKNKKHH